VSRHAPRAYGFPDAGHFHFYVRRGSAQSGLLKKFLRDCRTKNYRVIEDWQPRWLCNLLGLLRYPECHAVRFPSDFYRALDADFMGYRATPAMYTVHDIAALREPGHCTLRWHGVKLRRLALTLLAKSPAAVVTISNFTQSDLVECDPRFLGRTSVVYWGIDDIWFQDGLPDPGVPLPRPYWIWYGYMSRRKNLDGLLRGYARLLSSEAGAPGSRTLSWPIRPAGCRGCPSWS
jgi:glycosyltransferase involved in cell wall biosynthesis